MEIRRLLHNATAQDLVVALISGGGSSLLCAPASGLTLAHKTATNALLLACGADIHEINTVRKHLSLVKGGQLARAAHPAKVIALAVSDVVGDDLSVIASGPFTADPTTWQDALRIVQHYKLEDRLPKPVMQHLLQGSTGLRAETPKPGDNCCRNVTAAVIASNRQSLSAAAECARSLGYTPLILSSSITGDTAAAAAFHMAVLREIHASGNPLALPCCLISGGETTVSLCGMGLGGRNMEFVLHAVDGLAAMPRTLLASVGSDGTDGPTDAAGAFACTDSAHKAAAAGLNTHDYLAGNDSYHFFERLDQLVRPGPTRTNVMDIRIALAGYPDK
jgi:hydroxypyruvate reductase